MRVIRRYCRSCGEYKPHEKRQANHILHLLLSIVTCGIWLVVWLVLIVMSVLRPYRCRECGRAYVL